MILKIINKSHHPLPKYETQYSAGLDLKAFLPEGPITLEPLQRGLVKTGLFIELPVGYEAQVVINDGERIAQMVVARHEQAELVQVEELSETERGAGGFGHTGKN